ncbi:MAG: organic solvent tolerance protein OstA, partial [Planctomycetes bacterium]|nr:organic solvent tolerance protein OstA [Planctomycetota bacterium]
EGIRVGTRQEIDVPLLLGPVKVVPYVLGEVAHWEEDINQQDVTRLYGQSGVRSSLTFWKTDPLVQSRLFNLNGLSHELTLEGDVFYADAEEDLSRFPLYDPLDDDAQEHFRRRFIQGAYGGMLPLRFDERFYALRTGMQGFVSAPTLEIADDLAMARFGVSQRWQTKRGLPGQERIVDWIALDVEGVLFPEPNRDNFGEELGLVDYNFRWHVGDRVAILSDGFYDFFPDGLKTVSLGTLLTRPGRTELYLGIRSIEGPISSNIVTASAKYRMSEKWIASASTSYDLGPTGNIGQTLGLTRIGESAFFHVGFNVDESRDNVGVTLAVEPRFLPSRRTTIAGVPVPPPGAMGLE